MTDAAEDHLPDADLAKRIHRRRDPPKRTAEVLETLLAERDRELAEERAENHKLKQRLKRHLELD